MKQLAKIYQPFRAGFSCLHKHFRYASLSILIFITFQDTYGQDFVDSLLVTFENELEETREAVDQNNRLAFSMYYNYPELTERIAKRSYETARNIGYIKGQAGALNIIGTAMWTIGDLADAQQRFFDALELYNSIPDSIGAANSLLNIANVYDEVYLLDTAINENREKALNYAHRAAKIFEMAGNEKLMSRAYNNLGTMFFEGEYVDSAIFYLKKSLELKEKTKDIQSIANTLNNIGIAYKNLEIPNYDLALSYYDRALQIRREINDYEGLTTVLTNIGRIRILQENYDLAEPLLLESLYYADSLGSKKRALESYANLLRLEFDRGNLDKAIDYQKLYYQTKLDIVDNLKGSHIERLELSHKLKDRENQLTLISNELNLMIKKHENEKLLRVILITGIVMIIVLGLIFYIILNNKMKRDKQYQIAKRALTNAELENAKLKEKELQQELQFRNKELTSYILNLAHKNQMLDDIKTTANNIIKATINPDIKKQLNRFKQVINQNQTQEKDWEGFKLYFENVHKEFFTILKTQFPELTASDLKLCALIRLKMNLKETGDVLGVTAGSIKTARYRVKKKLGLGSEDDLLEFLTEIAQNDIELASN